MSIEGPVTESNVTKLYFLRERLKAATNPDMYNEILQEYGLPLGVDDKTAMSQFLERNFPTSPNKLAHLKKMHCIVSNLAELFRVVAPQSSLHVFGSFSIGTINGAHSDLDLLAVMGRSNGELQVLERLSEIGLVLSNELSQVAEAQAIANLGNGLARIYAVSQDGVEVEFHVMGIADALSISKMHPGFVRRVKPIQPKKEIRVSFKGIPRVVPKGPDTVHHYINVEGEIFKGFFPDAFIMASILSDPSGIGEKVRYSVWFAAVKAYLYQNGHIQKLRTRGFGIKLEVISFDAFLETIMPLKKAFTPERYKIMLDYFCYIVQGIIEKYGFVLL